MCALSRSKKRLRSFLELLGALLSFNHDLSLLPYLLASKTLWMALTGVIRVITRFADKRLTACFEPRAYNDGGPNMTYATSSPAATSGGQGQVPVS